MYIDSILLFKDECNRFENEVRYIRPFFFRPKRRRTLYMNIQQQIKTTNRYIEYAWFQITSNQRLNFMNTIYIKNNENPDTFALVRLSKVEEEMERPPGYPECIENFIANQPIEFWNSMTESEQEILMEEIEVALGQIE